MQLLLVIGAVVLLAQEPTFITSKQVEEEVFSSLGHSIDHAAMEIMENNAPHPRERRAIYDKFDETVKYTTSVTERQNVLLDKIIPKQKIGLTHPHDVKAFSLYRKEYLETQSFSGAELFLAIAENYHGNKNYTSRVSIHKYHENTTKFTLERTIDEYAPHRIEFFSITAHTKHPKYFLAVGGKESHPVGRFTATNLNIYSVSNDPIPQFNKIFHMPMSVSAIKYVFVEGECLLVAAERKSQFTSFLTIFRYNPTINNFEAQTRYPVSSITDVEAVVLEKTTYLVVAVYDDYFGKLTAKSLVFFYNSMHHAFELHTKFLTVGALDIEIFTPSLTPYVIVSNEASGVTTNKVFNARSYVYRVDRNFKMKKVSTIATIGGKQTSAIKLPGSHHKKLILSIDARNTVDQIGVNFFDKIAESVSNVPVTFFDGVSSGFRSQPNRIISFMVGNEVLVVAASENENATNVFSIQYEVQDVSGPSDKLFAYVDKEMKKLYQAVTTVETFLSHSKQIMDTAVYTDNEQTILGKTIFKSKLNINTTEISQLILKNGSILYEKDGIKTKANPQKYSINITVKELEKEFAKQNSSVRNASIKMKDVYFVDVPTNVTGRKSLKTVNLASIGMANNVDNIAYVNNIDLNFMLKDIVRQGKSEVITGSKMFSQISMGGNLTIKGLINGLNLSHQAVTLSGDQIIKATKTVNGKFRFDKSINIDGKINGVDISEEVVNLKDDITISGRKTFANVINIGNATVEQDIDKVNVTALENDALIKDGNQTITGNKVFNNSLKSNGNADIFGQVNKIDLKNLSESVIRFDVKKQNRNGVVSFVGPVNVEKNLTVLGQLNQLVFPTDVVLINTTQNITGTKTFVKELSTLGDLKVDGLVDGMNISDFVTLSTEQFLTGKKDFLADIDLKQHLIMKNWSTINGLQARKMNENIMKISDNQNVSGKFNFTQQLIFEQEPSIMGKLDDVTLSYFEKLYKNSVLKDGDQKITGYKMFDFAVNVEGNLTIDGYVNGYKIPRDYMMLSGEQNISGRYTFRRNVNMQGNVTIGGLLSQINLNKLSDSMVDINSNQRISGKKTFHNLSVQNDSVCFGKVNGVKISNLMSKNTIQTVVADKYFNRITVENVAMTVKNNVSVKRTVDGADLSELKRRAVYKEQVVSIGANQKFQGNVTAKNVQVTSINGVNISEIANDAVTLNTNQEVKATKQFEKVVMKKNLLTNSTIDQINVAEMKKQIVTTMEDAAISGNKTFRRAHVVKHLSVKGLIQNINLIQLNRSALLKNQDIRLPGRYNVTGKVFFAKHLHVGNINGYRPQEDFVLNNKKQNISGVKTFVNDLTVTDDVNLKGKMNKIDISMLKKDAVLKNKPQIIYGRKSFSNMKVKGDVEVEGKVDGVDLKELNRTLARIDRYQEIAKSAIFTGPVSFKQSLTIQGLTNNHNLRRIFDDAVTISGNQIITGKKIFSTSLKVKNNLTAAGSLTLKGFLNGVNITLLHANTMDKERDQNITGTKTFTKRVKFEKNLKIDKLLDNINTSNIVKVYDEQTISGQKTFIQGIKLVGNASVFSLVDGKDLQLLKNDTMLCYEPNIQKVAGDKKFQVGPKFLKDINLLGLLDGVNFSEVQNITLHGDSETLNSLTFLNLNVESNITTNGSQFGQFLQSLWRSRITLATNQTINGDIDVTNNVNITKEIILNGTVNHIDLQQLDSWENQTMINFHKRKNEKKQDFDSQCKALNYVERSLKAAPLRLDFFEEYQNLPHSYSHHLHFFTVNKQHFLASAANANNSNFCIDSVIYIWNLKQKKFIEHQNLRTSGARKFLFFEESGKYFLAVANMHHGCGMKGPSMIFQLNVTSLNFIYYQSLESNKAADIGIFKRKNTTFLLVANSYDATKQSDKASLVVWKMNATDSYFSVRQKIATADATALSTFAIGNQSMVAIAVNYNPVTGSSETNSLIYATRSRFLSLAQKIYTSGAKDFVTFVLKGETYLVMADMRDFVSSWLSPVNSQVRVLKYSNATSQFEFFQAIEAKNSRHIEVFRMKNQIFLSVVEIYKGFVVYEFKTGMGFLRKLGISHNGLVSTTYFEINNQAFLSLAANSPSFYTQSQKAVSKIFRIVESGVNTDQISTELNNC